MNKKLEKCIYCGWYGYSSDFEWEHKNPNMKTDSLLNDFLSGNLARACSGCNRQKGDKTLEEYVVWRAVSPAEANFGPLRPHTFIDLLLQRVYQEAYM